MHTHRPRRSTLVLPWLALGAALAAACGSSGSGSPTVGAPDGGNDGTSPTDSGQPGDSASPGDTGVPHDGGPGGDASPGTEGGATEGGPTEGGLCASACSPDQQSVVDCTGKVLQACAQGQGCDPTTVSCAAACTAAAHAQGSTGCEYYATHMAMDYADQCFAVFISNASNAPAHIAVELYAGTPLTVANFTRLLSGSGPTPTYGAYDPVAGLPPKQAAIVFLSGSNTSNVVCPISTTASPAGTMVSGTGKGQSFHITTDVPVAVHEMSPYGGGAASITGASTLLPTSAWDTNYVAVTAAPFSSQTNDPPSLNIVASADGTQVTLLPPVAIAGGGTLAAGPTAMPYTFTLNKGEQAQFAQQADLTGTVIQASSPVGVMAGNACMQEPIGTAFCDHGEQMLPPVRAMGSEYAAVMFRPRVTGDQAFWRIVGAVKGTTLTYAPATPAGAPTTIDAGQVVELTTDVPFVVSSQDAQHPFMLFTLMSGSQWSQLSTAGYGDPDFVLDVPTHEYQSGYTFFADSTFPENDLVLVRARNATDAFDDVTLDCLAAPVTGWQAVGNYEWTRVDLTSHDFQNQGSCAAGYHQASSRSPFGLWVWGWGSPETQGGSCSSGTAGYTCNVSYGYPGGLGVRPINAVVIAAQ